METQIEMPKVEAVLFDLDGVLVDACDWHFNALNEAMREIAGFELSREDHVLKYNGLPTAVKLRMLGFEGSIASRIEAAKQIKTLDIISKHAEIMTEKQELHSYLKSQGIKIACVTNSIRETAELMLSKTGQLDYIDLLVTNEDVSPNKPYPVCYNYAIQKLNANPDTSLCVEDSPKGIEAAKASCIPNLWIVSNPSEVTLETYKRIIR